MIHSLETKWKENLQFEVNIEGRKIDLDAPAEVGGDGNGFRSKPLMLASLSGCTGIDVASLIKKMRLEVDDFIIKTDANLSEEHPQMYETVKLTYIFSGANLNEEKLTKAVDLSVTKYCGVMAMFKAFAKIEIDIIFNP